MGITSWFSARQKALDAYKRGMAKAKKKDFPGAIEEYSTSLKASKIPADVKAMALYNRALAYSATEDETNAAKDLADVLAMPTLPEKIRTAASQRAQRMQKRKKKAQA